MKNYKRNVARDEIPNAAIPYALARELVKRDGASQHELARFCNWASGESCPPPTGDVVCQYEDKRSKAQKTTHTRAVVALDPGMSGWGKARDGASYCAWALHPDVDSDQVMEWVESRSDMSDVELVNIDAWDPPKGTAHLSIWPCNPGHVATHYKPES